MIGHYTFGTLVKEKRLGSGKTLREFCIENGFDAVNMSKLERGRLRAPQAKERLERYARALGLQAGSDDWHLLMDLAAAESDRDMSHPLSDEEVARKLPLWINRSPGERIPDEKLHALVKLVREA